MEIFSTFFPGFHIFTQYLYILFLNKWKMIAVLIKKMKSLMELELEPCLSTKNIPSTKEISRNLWYPNRTVQPL